MMLIARLAVVLAVAGLVVACEPNAPKDAPPKATGAPSGAPQSQPAQPPPSPAASTEKKESVPPVQGQVDAKQEPQKREFETKK